MTEATADQRRRILPPYSVRRDFLPPQLVADLLAFAEAHEAEFEPAKVGSREEQAVNPAVRISSRIRKFDPLRGEVARRVRPLAGELAAELKVKPFETAAMELELVAHNDGAFYNPHIDLVQSIGPQATMRVLSGVYYFHARPKAFEGGALRLLEIGNLSESRGFVDIEPADNTLVFFPSWMPHEVRKVSCPSRRFLDSRFAINCWFHKAS